MTFMLEEIRQQPDIVARLCEEAYPSVTMLARDIKQRGVKAVSIAARGTSDNAATYGKYLLEIEAGLPVSLAAPSVFTLYNAKLDLSQWLMLGISQSGESTDVVEVLRQARSMGALTAGITNASGSPLAREADFVLLCNAGDEKSVAATKTYTSTLAILALLSGVLSGKTEVVQRILDAAQAMRSVLEMSELIRQSARSYLDMQECMVIARGVNQCTCQEAALKLAETCYVVAKPYSSADFLHGPIASIDEGFVVFIYAPPGKGYPDLLQLSEQLWNRRAEMVIVSSEDGILSKAATPIRIPVGIDESYSPLVYITAGQLFAESLSVAKGHNPDQPRYLSKITRTV